MFLGLFWMSQVWKSKPAPAPASTRDTNPRGSQNPWHSLMKEDMVQARDECLGPKELQTRKAPTKTGSTYAGGTHFECNGQAKPVKENTWCYTIGNSYGGLKKIMAPCTGRKVTGDKDAKAIRLRSQLLKVKSFCQCLIFPLTNKINCRCLQQWLWPQWMQDFPHVKTYALMQSWSTHLPWESQTLWHIRRCSSISHQRNFLVQVCLYLSLYEIFCDSFAFYL